MTTKQITTCDACGRELTNVLTEIRVTVQEYTKRNNNAERHACSGKCLPHVLKKLSDEFPVTN